MNIQLSQQAKEVLGKSALVIMTERVDDVALLIGQRVTMGLPEVLDRPLPRHGTQRGLSWGWTAVMWLAHMLTEGDHRKVSVEASIKGMQYPLSRLTAQAIDPLDFRDDRLSHLLQHVSKSRYWHRIAPDVKERSIEVYALPQHGIRCEATTVSGDHEVTAGGLLQCGQRKADPTRPHITVLMGSLDPLGMPLSTEVFSGERADDGVDIPIIDRIRAGLRTSGVLCVGAGKMSALDTRGPMVRHQHVYVSPWPFTGATAETLDAWIAEGVAQDEAGALARMLRTNDRGHEVLAAEGDACDRPCCVQEGEEAWTERGLVVRSPAHAARQAAGGTTRLVHAEKHLTALTPPRGRGKRQITDEATLVEAIATVLTTQRVGGWLSGAWEKQRERQPQYGGRGRGSASREKRVSTTTRSSITPIARQEDKSAALTQQVGWKAFVTNAGQKQRS